MGSDVSLVDVARHLVRCSSVLASELFTSIKNDKFRLSDTTVSGRTRVSKVSSVKMFMANEKLPVSVE